MRITEALKILNVADKTSSPFAVALACGFTPLHVSTFLAAHLQRRLNNRRIEVLPGTYGDLAGTLESLHQTSVDAVAIALEWADLDPRLSFRSEGRWGTSVIDDIVSQTPRALQRIAASIERIPTGIPIAISMPTLLLPPLFHTPGWQSGESEAELDAMIANFADTLHRRVQLVNARRLSEESAPAQRFDLKADLATGLPYTLGHADALAAAFSRLLVPPPPKRGLITDLDDTLWAGLVGEVGPEAISWDLAGHKAMHGLYQRLLAALAEEGVLVAVASKNDANVVERAFEREGIFLPATSVFPMEVHWNAKSLSVTRILQHWNIAADSVVFVDDNPMELAEVAAAHPGIECIHFVDNSYQMLQRIRDLFGKARLTQEDGYRLNSLRARADDFATRENQGASEDFLEQLKAVITVDFAEGPPEARVLELVNKTNQFNLNGIRYTEAEWAKRLLAKDSILAVVSYEDKYGPLGRISVLQGMLNQSSLKLSTWVLSCRAFARRIEHQCIHMLFEHYGIDTIEFSFAGTTKNSLLSEFLTSACGLDGFVLTRARFQGFCPRLYHTVREARRVEVNG